MIYDVYFMILRTLSSKNSKKENNALKIYSDLAYDNKWNLLLRYKNF